METETMHFENYQDAESRVCTAIASLGRLAGIDVDLGEGPDDIDANLIQAAYESNFADPVFLGGPGCFARIDQPGALAAVDARASRVTRRLAHYIARRGGEEAAQQAQAHMLAVDAALAWLRQHRAP
jgi:hypothetical protein